MQKHKLPSPRQAREAAGLTWRGLAAAARVSQSTIKRVEDSGRYPKNYNTRIAYLRALGLEVA